MRNLKIASLCAAMAVTMATDSAICAQTVKDYSLKLNDFTELKVLDGINVDYSIAPSADSVQAHFEAPDNMASAIRFEQKDSRLTIRLSEEMMDAKSIPTVHVSSTMLVKIQNNGDSTVTANTGNVRVPKFQVRLEGNGSLIVAGVSAPEVNVKKFTGRGTIAVEGECTTASIGNTGTGSVNCASLLSQDAKGNVIGTGSIYCHATGTLSVTGMSGTVYFGGNPKDIKSRTLGVKLKPIEQLEAE